MTIILCNDKSVLKSKIEAVLEMPYSIHSYNEHIDVRMESIVITIEQNLSTYQEDLLSKMRQATYVVGVWAKDATSNYLSKSLENLFDSIICEKNLIQLKSLLESKKTILQTPDCSEIKIKDIIRVNCQTGKKLK